ncbi:hypothetical protein ACJMK2_019388 [Sinanodonta woodiana]|uniref:Ig-like domain-containing protein n=1 Tax=Sinanodonta woodiana TaxID=1069815 RepID=A0ABD3UGB2_SINWO
MADSLFMTFTWKNVSKQIIACEHDVISIHWEYNLKPGEYVKAKTWFTGGNKTARRIAYWKDTDGLTIESQYKDRATMTGQNSLILRDVTTYDEGPYTLILSFPLSSEPDPRLTVDLIVYISPLNEAGCCKPDINASHTELRAFVKSALVCGKPTPSLTWTNSRNKTVANGSLILGSKDRAGTYTVCATGPAIDTCLTGGKDNLCKSLTIEMYQFQKAVCELKLKIKLNSGSTSESDIDVHSYTDVLCKHGEHLRRIFITGEVGCGKKTLCNSLTRDWCDAQSDTASDKDSSNIQFLRNFKLIFNVSLKNIENLSSVNQLHLLEHKAILVIRGLNEYHGSLKDILNLLSSKRLQDYLIIVTSTPNLFDNTYKSVLSFDRIIFISMDFLRKHSIIIFYLITERGLEKSTAEPVFFPFLVTMWQTNCSLPSNKAEFLLNVIENKIKDEDRSLAPNTSLAQETSIYRSDLGNSPVFMHKEFTLYYGKIIHGIGKIACTILCIYVTFDAMEFDSTFMSQDCYDQVTIQFMKYFLLSETKETKAAEKLKSTNNFSDFLKFINPN